MLCRSHLSLRLDPKRDPDALKSFLMALGQHLRPTEKSTLTPLVFAGQNKGVLLEIARSLPATAGGFSIGFDAPKLLTAGDILSADVATLRQMKQVQFDGNLLEHLSLDAALALVERCLTTDDGWRRGMRASLNGRAFSVEGSDRAVVSFHVHDLENYPTKKMMASATHEMPV